VERAREIYSFSHLTFQEYFTAREIERERQLEILVQNITNPRWKEVFYLTAEMLRRSDDLLLLMKARIDLMLAGDEKLQDFLDWVRQKTDLVQFSHEIAAVRAFYYGISLSLDLSLSLSLSRSLDLSLGDTVLKQSLQVLKNRLPDPDGDFEVFSQWWETNGKEWSGELRQVCIEHRNICHDWQFTYEQADLLEQYYFANLLLVECMNRSYVSKEVREEIESTLLLPIKALPAKPSV